MQKFNKHRTDIDLILNFISSIGIEYQMESDVIGPFSENIDIKNGVIHFDYERVLVGDLLHEAGHLALVLKEYRKIFNGNLYKSLKQYVALVTQLEVSDQCIETLLACEDVHVTAWVWSVGIKLGLNPDDVIQTDKYGGEGDSIRELLQISDRTCMPYIGVAQLQAAGYTKKYNRMIEMQEPHTKFYPHLNFWTVDEALITNNFKLSVTS